MKGEEKKRGDEGKIPVQTRGVSWPPDYPLQA
jgi:hypothetical protein